MKLSFYRTGTGKKNARAFGFSVAYGYFSVEEIDETRKQLTVSAGCWWFIASLQLWRQK